MKSDVIASFIQMDAEVLKALLAEVKETVATGLILPEPAKYPFRAADMWNIRRKARSASSMIRR